MKEYTVRYSMNGYWYESKVCTTSSDAALYWAMRWSEDAYVVSEKELPKEWYER